MAGHSKWAQIKRKKEATDARKGQIFTKISREIAVAVRQGGPDPEANYRLRLAIQKARSINMPADNIKRAIERAAGEGSNATNYEEITYEGYGPAGVAVLVETLTDNRNRTVSEIRNVFNRSGGRLGESGSVSWIFDEKGLIVVEPDNQHTADDIALAAIEAGAEDVTPLEDGTVEVYTQFQDLKSVEESLEQMGFKVASAEKVYIPNTYVEPSDTDAQSILKFIERLEDLDDVQEVYTNMKIEADVAMNATS